MRAHAPQLLAALSSLPCVLLFGIRDVLEAQLTRFYQAQAQAATARRGKMARNKGRSEGEEAKAKAKGREVRDDSE
jgi:hypothetical protein